MGGPLAQGTGCRVQAVWPHGDCDRVLRLRGWLIEHERTALGMRLWQRVWVPGPPARPPLPAWGQFAAGSSSGGGCWGG